MYGLRLERTGSHSKCSETLYNATKSEEQCSKRVESIQNWGYSLRNGFTVVEIGLGRGFEVDLGLKGVENGKIYKFRVGWGGLGFPARCPAPFSGEV